MMDLDTLIALMAASLLKHAGSPDEDRARAVRQARRLWEEVCKG